MDKWGLYELLKGNRVIDNEVIQLVEEMNRNELREAVLEYLMLLKQNKSPPVGKRGFIHRIKEGVTD